MNYDFSKLCANQLEMLEKRLKSLKKKSLSEYETALSVINNYNANQKSVEIEQEIDDLLNDTINRTNAIYTECLNKIQRVIGSHIQ